MLLRHDEVKEAIQKLELLASDEWKKVVVQTQTPPANPSHIVELHPTISASWSTLTLPLTPLVLSDTVLGMFS